MKKKLYWIGGIFSLIIIGALTYFYVVGVHAIQKEQLATQVSKEKHIAGITNIAKQLVGSYLKSPGSAQFINLAVGPWIKEVNHFGAFGDVDSQNSFGALLRSHFFLEFSHGDGNMGDINNWKIEWLELDGTTYVLRGDVLNPPLSPTEKSLSGAKELEDVLRQLWK